MLTADGVITAARDRHPAFDRIRNPDAVLLRHLSAYVRELQGKVALIDPDILRTEEAVALPLVDHEAGITLPANRYVAAVAARAASEPTATYPIALISADSRADRNAPAWAAWQLGNKLYLRSPAALWGHYSEIGISLVATPLPLVALESELAIPDTAEMACVESLALLMARRGHADKGLAPISVNEFRDAFERAEQAFLADVANAIGAREGRIRDVWEPTGMIEWGSERRFSP